MLFKACAIIINTYSFIIYFLELETLHYRLERHPDSYSMASLSMLLVHQLVHPFTFLYNLTAATCWHHLLSRYLRIGVFTLGKKPALSRPPTLHQGLKAAFTETPLVSLTYYPFTYPDYAQKSIPHFYKKKLEKCF